MDTYTIVAEIETAIYDQEEHKDLPRVTGKRWFILLMFIISCSLNNMQWIQYSVIADITVNYYNVSYTAVNWTSMVFLLFYSFLVLPGIYFTDTYGLRKSVLLNTVLTCLGAWVKVFSVERDKFWLVLVGQSIVAISAVMIISVPSALAATWFGSNEVSTACSIGLNGFLVGVAIGCLVPSFAVSKDGFESGWYIMLLIIAILTTTILILQFIFFVDKPKYPPSKAQQQQILIKKKSTEFMKTILNLVKNFPFLVHVSVFGVTYGVFCSVIALINQLLSDSYQNKSAHAGLIGVIFQIAGIVGSIACGVLLDKFHKYKSTYIALQIGCIASMILFTYTLGKSIIFVYIASGALGLFIISVQPVASEIAIEFTYPDPQGVTVGLLFGTAQIFAITITYLHSHLLYTLGVLSANNIIALALFVVLIVIFFIPFRYKRFEINFSND